MTKTKKSKTKREYRLGDLCVCPDDGEGSGYWGQTVFLHGQPNASGVTPLYETDSADFDEPMDCTGKASVSDGVLWLSSTKAYTPAGFDTPAEYVAFLAGLPPWPLSMARWAWREGTLVDCRTGLDADLHDPEAKVAWQGIMALRYSPENKAATQRHIKELAQLLRKSDKTNPTRQDLEQIIAEDAAELAEWERLEKGA